MVNTIDTILFISDAAFIDALERWGHRNKVKYDLWRHPTRGCRVFVASEQGCDKARKWMETMLSCSVVG